MPEMSVSTTESAWLVALIVMLIIVGAVFFGLSPQLRNVTFSFLCNSFYDFTYFFFGPRPPIELCGSTAEKTTGTTTTAPPLAGPQLPFGP